MGRDVSTRLVPDVAREVAIREGLKAFVRVDVLSSGDTRYLSASLVSAENGQLLDSEGAIAKSANDVVAATDRLTRELGGRFADRIASTEGRERLYPVTTDSIRALLKHMEAFLAYRLRGDALRATELAEEAIAIDPSFAQAHLNLHHYLGAQGGKDRRTYQPLLEAYRLRERLSPYERNLVEAEYYLKVEDDPVRAVDRYRDHVREAKKFGRNQVIVSYLGLASVHLQLGDLDEAERVLQESRTWFPGPFNQAMLVRVLYSLGRRRRGGGRAVRGGRAISRERVAENGAGTPGGGCRRPCASARIGAGHRCPVRGTVRAPYRRAVRRGAGAIHRSGVASP
jgi:tetratricopeptide (TPR) repeat protein